MFEKPPNSKRSHGEAANLAGQTTGPIGLRGKERKERPVAPIARRATAAEKQQDVRRVRDTAATLMCLGSCLPRRVVGTINVKACLATFGDRRLIEIDADTFNAGRDEPLQKLARPTADFQHRATRTIERISKMHALSHVSGE